MQPDPTIDEICEVRRKISAEFGHDPRRLMAHYMELEKEMRRSGKYKFRDAGVERPEESPILQDKPRKEQT
jgi:hypothetical protein